MVRLAGYRNVAALKSTLLTLTPLPGASSSPGPSGVKR